MRVAVFDTHRYDQEALEAANVDHGHEIVFFEPRLNSSTAVLARGFRAVCSFVNDRMDKETLGTLRQGGTDTSALRLICPTRIFSCDKALGSSRRSAEAEVESRGTASADVADWRRCRAHDLDHFHERPS